MTEQTLQLDIPLLVPEIEDVLDDCLRQLERLLENRRGIHRVHVTENAKTPKLCLHYDPNLISLAAVERAARETGSQFTTRYRHETIPLSGMTSADAADSLAALIRELPGMLHANVNYAAGLAFVAFDTEKLTRQELIGAIQQLGYKPIVPDPGGALGVDESEPDHDHGSAPAFLPHWLQERWTLVLVVLAGSFFLVGWLGELAFGMPAGIALLFFILSYIAGGYDIATHAIPGLLKGKFDTDVLMLAAAAGAALLGEWAEGAFLLFLFSLGHAGEHYALDRARNAINALGELMPKSAQVRQGDKIVEKPVAQVLVEDVVVVRPGDRIPVDGEVVSGDSAVDQSAITGESMPVNKQTGDQVFAGTVNQENALDIRVTKLARDNTLSRVMQMVAEAQDQQSPTQQLTQRFTAKFVPAILVFVLLVIVVPPLAGWMAWSDSFYRGMLLLVAASPCALAIGTPASVLAGIAQAARNGVLIKGGVHLENLGDIQVMAFDKTGTLTEGKFQVTTLAAASGVTANELLEIAASVEQLSNHPLALAVVRAAQERGLSLPSAEGLENVVGLGVKSEVHGKPVQIGSLRMFTENQAMTPDELTVQTVAELEMGGNTTMVVRHGDRYLGVIALADQPRVGVRETLQQLLGLGILKLVMLTGDNTEVARQIALEVGVTDVRAELMPEDKLVAIQELKDEFGAIAMTGDGVNDAPALATATVGIAMGGAGTAVALETADVALMADDLAKLPLAVGLSRASKAIIRQNLAISLGIIGILILTSVVGIVELSGAVILHEGSTIIVVLNALRLLRYRL